MKNKKNKIRQKNKETEEDKKIIDIVCKLGGKNKIKNKQKQTKQTR